MKDTDVQVEAKEMAPVRTITIKNKGTSMAPVQ
jgi:hypothetical protein